MVSAKTRFFCVLALPLYSPRFWVRPSIPEGAGAPALHPRWAGGCPWPRQSVPTLARTSSPPLSTGKRVPKLVSALKTSFIAERDANAPTTLPPNRNGVRGRADTRPAIVLTARQSGGPILAVSSKTRAPRSEYQNSLPSSESQEFDKIDALDQNRPDRGFGRSGAIQGSDSSTQVLLRVAYDLAHLRKPLNELLKCFSTLKTTVRGR